MNKPYSNFAQPLPDMRSRETMRVFLLKHPRYGFDFCQCVKLPVLNIPADLQDAAYAALEMPEPYHEIEKLFEAFRLKHGNGSPASLVGGAGNVRIGFEGRSGGYIVMYNAEADQDYFSLSIEELRKLVRLVHAFDELCDQAVTIFMEFVTSLVPAGEEESDDPAPVAEPESMPLSALLMRLEVSIYRRDSAYWVVPRVGQSFNSLALTGAIFDRQTLDPAPLALDYPITEDFAKLNASPVDAEEASAVIEALNSRYTNRFRLVTSQPVSEAE